MISTRLYEKPTRELAILYSFYAFIHFWNGLLNGFLDFQAVDRMRQFYHRHRHPHCTDFEEYYEEA